MENDTVRPTIYKNTEPEIIQMALFITINLLGILLFSKDDSFINCNDLQKM